MKKILAALICFTIALLIVVIAPGFSGVLSSHEIDETAEIGLFGQHAVRVVEAPVTIHPVYRKGELIGIIHDENKLTRHLKQVYKTRYEKDFPDSSVSLAQDLYMTSEESYLSYSDADQKILDYLDENSLYSLEATAVAFSDENGVYSRIYVASEDLYQQAFNEYILNFTDAQSLTSMRNGDTIPSLTSYGSQDTGISVSQRVTTNKDYASPDNIFVSKEAILEYLKYGSNTEREYYTVQKYDTVAGVGAKNHGLSAIQIMNLNRDKISSVDQALKEGDELCVTYFESPIDVVVTKESLRLVPVYYETTYVEDETLLIGESQVRQAGANGSRNVLYNEKWINGVLVSGIEQSSVEVTMPTTEVIAVGTMQLPNIGTGNMRYPVDNPAITCRIGCYWGHNGTDFINQYDRWGDVYAADTGEVQANSYTFINGYYIIINHNNGLMTYYGHLREPSELKVGDVVRKGDVIGHIGMTGLATGPHVHFMVLNEGDENFINPLDACSGYLGCEAVPAG
ncbi:MAG: M23 family metallopeptidase [Solobacterium sp.]|nr:M23 family metallopeptidase [Solobacterium sp.]